MQNLLLGQVGGRAICCPWLIHQRPISKNARRRYPLIVTYPEGDAKQLRHTMLQLKTSLCLNTSALSRAAIAEMLDRLEQVQTQELDK